jgi:hypothetical protein
MVAAAEARGDARGATLAQAAVELAPGQVSVLAVRCHWVAVPCRAVLCCAVLPRWWWRLTPTHAPSLGQELLAGAEVWVAPPPPPGAGAGAGAGAAAAGGPSAARRRRKAMLVDENQDGTWNLVYHQRDPARVWAEGEEEEADIPPDRLTMAKKQELTRSRRARNAPGGGEGGGGGASTAAEEPAGLHVVAEATHESEEALAEAVSTGPSPAWGAWHLRQAVWVSGVGAVLCWLLCALR